SQILLQLDRWALQASLMRITQIVLGLASIVCSLLVAMQINTFKARTLKWLAFTSALSVGVLSSFGFGEKANNFRNAWRMLNTAVIRYEVAPDSTKLMELIDVYSEAEKVIGDVQFESKE